MKRKIIGYEREIRFLREPKEIIQETGEAQEKKNMDRESAKEETSRNTEQRGVRER